MEETTLKEVLSVIELKLSFLNKLWEGHMNFSLMTEPSYCYINVVDSNGKSVGPYSCLFYRETGGREKTFAKILEWVENAIHGTCLTNEIQDSVKAS